MVVQSQTLLSRLEEVYFKIYEPLGVKKADFLRLKKRIEAAKTLRSDLLKERDKRPSDWFLSEKMVGVTLYVDLFSKDLHGLLSKLPYFKEMGITYIHLMPLLKPRQGNSDGGYAVEDYRDIDPKVGTLKDFKEVVETFAKEGISIAIDFVINHTAKEHEWAKKAATGDPFYQAMYMMYDTDEIPNEFNKTVPEVLPDIYPGNFTYYDSFKKYVFKSFSEFQWDLNFRNPFVIEEILDIFFFLANIGVDIVRLDAIPFVWKELGTTCRNLPLVHDFMHLFHLAKEMVCPSVVLLGEAIVEPHEIVKYFGSEVRPECGLMYNANLMVNLWNSLATKDARIMTIDNSRFYIPSTGGWVNYIRCHDDIGWGLNEEGLRDLGFNPFEHKQFLINFYRGNFYSSFARGKNYQFNPVTLDARTNGTLASLAGVEKAIEEKDQFGLVESINRVNLLHSFLFAHPGIPLIYSGDEVGILNDPSHLKDPAKQDGRWIHRPFFPWDKRAVFEDPRTPSGSIHAFIKKLIKLRQSNPIFNAKVPQRVLQSGNQSIYMAKRDLGNQQLVVIYNFSENHQYVNPHFFQTAGIRGWFVDLLQGKRVYLGNDTVNVYPYESLWLMKEVE